MAEKYIEVDGCRTRHWDSDGPGPVALMIHGIGGSLELWQGEFQTTPQCFRRILVDLPGHGLSDFGDQPYDPEKFARFAWRFLDALQVKEVHLVGNSMGGSISILMAGMQPKRVRGLVLAAAAMLGKDSPLPFRLMTLPILGSLLTRPSQMAVEQQLKAIFNPAFLIPLQVRGTVRRNVLRPGAQEAFRKTLCAMTTLRGMRSSWLKRSLDTLSTLTIPVLFIHGRQDGVIPYTHSVEAQKITRSSRVLILEGCGHTPQLEQAQAFNNLLLEFIGQGENGSGSN